MVACQRVNGFARLVLMNELTPTVYANNATTSWPKPDGVASAMLQGLDHTGSARRGSGLVTQSADVLLDRARTTCARFLGVGEPANLMFVPSATFGLNMIIGGFMQPGDAVIVARGEHNAVLRPLLALERQGAHIAWAPLDDHGFLDLAELEHLLQIGVQQNQPFKAVICNQGSNVSGRMQPLEEIVLLAHQYGAVCISDGAQVAGHESVDLGHLGVDAWVCSGHKGLLGPKGIGLMYLAPTFDLDITIWGGTGYGNADYLCDDRIRPDCYEPGTEPLCAILGLESGVRWLEGHPGSTLRAIALASQLRMRLTQINGVHVLGGEPGTASHLPLVSVTTDRLTIPEWGSLLQQRYGIITRWGIHCSPDAHRVLGSYPQGSVRFSLGPYNTQDDVDAIVEAVHDSLTLPAHS